MGVLRTSKEGRKEGNYCCCPITIVCIRIFTILQRRFLFLLNQRLKTNVSSFETRGEVFFFLIKRMDLIDSWIVNYYDRLISHEIAHPRLELLLLRACCYSWYIIPC